EFAAERIEDETKTFKRGHTHERSIAFFPEDDRSVSDFGKIFERSVTHSSLDLVAVSQKEGLCLVGFDSQFLKNTLGNKRISGAGIDRERKFHFIGKVRRV